MECAGCETSGWNGDGAEFPMWDIRVEWRRSRILDVRHPDGMAAEQSSGCETSGWNVDGATPSGFPKRTRSMLPYSDSLRENHMTLAIITHPDDSLSYSDMLFGSLSHTPCIPDLLMAKDFKASVLHVYELSIALPWIPKNSPQSLIALVIKKLSKHQNLTQFD